MTGIKLDREHFTLDDLLDLINRVDEWNQHVYRPRFDGSRSVETADTVWYRQTRLIRQLIKSVVVEIDSLFQDNLKMKLAELIIELSYKVSIRSHRLHQFHGSDVRRFVFDDDRVAQRDQLINSDILTNINFDRQKLEIKSVLLNIVCINETVLEDEQLDINSLLSVLVEIIIRVELYTSRNMVDYTSVIMDSKHSIFKNYDKCEITFEQKWITKNRNVDDVLVHGNGGLFVFKNALNNDVLYPSFYKEPKVEND